MSDLDKHLNPNNNPYSPFYRQGTDMSPSGMGFLRVREGEILEHGLTATDISLLLHKRYNEAHFTGTMEAQAEAEKRFADIWEEGYKAGFIRGEHEGLKEGRANTRTALLTALDESLKGSTPARKRYSVGKVRHLIFDYT